MSGNIPEWVQRSPRIFYAAAVLMFFAYFALGAYEIHHFEMPYGEEGPKRIAILRVIVDALRDAIYLFGTGVWVQVTLAIWARIRPVVPTEAAE